MTFSTPVRFSDESGGGELTGVKSTAHADTLFSALFMTLLQYGRDDQLLEATQKGSIRFSDLLPYRGDHLYIPRPCGSFGEAKRSEDPSLRKLLKKAEYIPLAQLNQFMHGVADLSLFGNDFAVAFDRTRVNRRDFDDPMPYQVSGVQFKTGCGLYIICAFEADHERGLFEEGLRLLGMSGIGGKHSSGWGKFDCVFEDAPAVLQTMLKDRNAPLQISLSCVLPNESESDRVMPDARYALIRRGGYSAAEGEAPQKKRTVFVMNAGATFTTRFDGTLLDVGIDLPHPVWKYAKGLFLGVSAS